MGPGSARCSAPSGMTIESHSKPVRHAPLPTAGLRPQRVADGAQPRQVLARRIDRGAPLERLVLRIALAQAPREFRLHQLGAEIEGVRGVGGETELWKQRERILRHVMTVAIV